MADLGSYGVALFWLAVLLLAMAVFETGRIAARSRAGRVAREAIKRAGESAAITRRVMTPAQREQASRNWSPEDLDGFLHSLEHGHEQ